MSIFNKILASIGIGSAKVDTHLTDDRVTPGGMLEGEIHLEGGDIEQDIDGIYLLIATKYKKETDDATYDVECILLKHQVSEGFHLQPKQQKKMHFVVQVPYQTPLSFGHQEVYIRTGLDIKQAIDPTDWDRLQVSPNRYMQQVFNALESLGFHLHKSECEYHRYSSPYPFIQEFEFKPSHHYRDQFDELEVIFLMQPNRLTVRFEIDRRARGLSGLFAEAMDMDESYASLHLTPEDLEQPIEVLINQIETILAQHSR